MTVVVENRVVGRLVPFLLAAHGRRNLHQKRSFLDGKIGKAIGSAAAHRSSTIRCCRGASGRSASTRKG